MRAFVSVFLMHSLSLGGFGSRQGDSAVGIVLDRYTAISIENLPSKLPQQKWN
jgi:hypothetical protein